MASFSTALSTLKTGMPVYRAAWGQEGVETVPRVRMVLEGVFRGSWGPSLLMVVPLDSAVDPGKQSIWLPSMEDLFANDWMITELRQPTTYF